MALRIFKLLFLALLSSPTVLALSLKIESLNALNHISAHAHAITERIIYTNLAKMERPFIPTNSLIMDGRLFYFTNIFKGDGNDRDMVIMFSFHGNFYVPRLLYKSISNGSWRVCPRIQVFNDQAFFSKGFRTHYTQETKPAEEIIAHLQWVENSLVTELSRQQYRAIENLFDRDFFNEETPEPAVFSYESEVSIYKSDADLEPFHKYQPGLGFHSTDAKNGKDVYKYFRNLKYPPGFLPNFSLPIREYSFLHTLLGQTHVKVFSGLLDGKDIEWHMAYDEKGRIWIDRINFKKQINSYGICSLVINSGLLTNKPLEYGLQINQFLFEDLDGEESIKPFEEDSSEIFDLSPLLDTLLPIRLFRKAQGISRSV